MTLELIPTANPYTLACRNELPFLLLLEGKPLEGALVVAYPYRDPSKSLRAPTSGEGQVSLRIEGAGPWLIKTVHIRRLPAGSRAAWESLWASLTFQIEELLF